MARRRSVGAEVAGAAERRAGVAGVLAFVFALAVPLALYLLTLYPGVGGRINPGDSIKFQYIGRILGVPHEPGYPQYVVLSFLWTLLPWPFETALQVNLLSAACTLLAGGFFWSALRRLTGRPVIATLGTWTLLLTTSVWIFSTEAEVHGLQLAWVCAALWLAIRWVESGNRRWQIALLAAVAFSFGNHPLAVVLLLAAAVLVLVVAPRSALSPRILGTGLLLAVLSFAQYGFLLLRAHSDTAEFVEAVPRQADLSELWSAMTGERFVNQHWMTGGVAGALEVAGDLIAATSEQIPLPAMLLVFVGVVAALDRRHREAAFLVTILIGSAIFCLAYQIPDPLPYFAHLWVPLAAFAAIGAAALPRRWRVAACILWAGFLTHDVVRRYSEVLVTESIYDYSALVSRAPAGTAVVLDELGPLPYPGIQLANYYNYAYPHKRPGVVVWPASQVLDGHAFLALPPIVFAAPEIHEALDESGAGSRPLGRRDDRGRPMWITRSRPMRRLTLRPGEQGITVGERGEPPLVEETPGIQAMVIDPQMPGLRAQLEIPWTSTPSTERRIWELLADVRRGDALCLVVQGDDPRRVHRLLERLAPRQVSDAGAVHSAVLLANLQVSRGWLHVLLDPKRQVLSIADWAMGRESSTR